MSASLSEIDNFPMNSICKKSRDISQQPIQISSPSQLKSPTLNSSYLSKEGQEILSPLQKKKALRFNFGGNWNNEQASLNNSSSNIFRSDQTKSKKWYNQFFPISQRDIKLEKFLYRQLVMKKFLLRLTQRIYSIHSKFYSSLIGQLLQEQYVKQIDSVSDKKMNQLQSKFHHYLQWNFFVSIIVTLSFITLPLQISLQLDKLQFLHIFVLVIFFIDILLEPFKPLLSEEQFITDKCKVAQNYVSTFLLFGIAKIILFIAIIEVQQHLIASIIFQLSYILISQYKQSYYLSELYSLFKQHIFVQYFIIFAQFILLSHVIACIWHQIGIQNENDSWLIDNMDKDCTTRYLLSLQWSIQNLLMINQSYILSNKLEILVSICVNIISIINMALLIKSFHKQTKHFLTISKKNQQILNDLTQFLSYHDVSIQLRIRIQKFLSRYFNDQSKSESQTKNTFISLLPSALRNELVYEQQMKEIGICKPLKRFSQEILKKTSQIMELQTFQPQEIIIQQNDYKDHSLYIIQSGMVQIYNQTSEQNYKYLKKHDSFGEWSFFTNQQRMASAKSYGFSKVYKIDAVRFKEIIQKSQRDRELYHLVKHQMLFQEQLQYAHLKCYGCQSNRHLIRNCPKLTYKPDLEKLILLDNVNQQKRKIYLRKNIERKRLTSRTFYNIPIIIQSLKCFREKNQMISEEESELDIISSQTITDQYDDNPENSFDSLIDQQRLEIVPFQTKLLNEIDVEQDNDQSNKKQQDAQQYFLKLISPQNQDQINKINSQKIQNQQNDQQKKVNDANLSMLKSQLSLQKATSIKLEQCGDDFKPLEVQLNKQKKNNEREVEYNKKGFGDAMSDNLKKKLPSIQEQSNINSLHLSCSEAYSFSPQTKTKNYQQNPPKLFKMTSGISTIPRLKSHTQKISQQSCQLLQDGIDQIKSKSIFNFNHQSMLELSFEKEEDFEIKQNYQYFFPYYNYQSVIVRYNIFREKCIHFEDRFKYSLYYRNKLRFMFEKKNQ